MPSARNFAIRIGQAAAAALLITLALSAFQGRSASPQSSPSSASPALATAAELACFSDGVTCSHAADCCSAGCVNGRCGERTKPKRRLAAR